MPKETCAGASASSSIVLVFGPQMGGAVIPLAKRPFVGQVLSGLAVTNLSNARFRNFLIFVRIRGAGGAGLESAGRSTAVAARIGEASGRRARKPVAQEHRFQEVELVRGSCLAVQKTAVT